MKKAIQRWEIAGIVFIVVVGSLWHFIFEWAGSMRPLALFFPVNESTWEHFKLGFWPGLIWLLIELPFIRKKAKNIAIAKAAGLLAIPIVTAVLFYAYTAVTGQHHLFADISIFVVAVIVGQWISMRLMTRPAIEIPWLRLVSLGVLVAMTVAFLTFSFYPPKNFLFVDPRNGEYGILSEIDHDDH
jgi:hypothetical protein